MSALQVAAPGNLKDPLEPEPYDLFFESLDEVLGESVDTSPCVIAQAVAESLGYRWRHVGYKDDGTVEVRLGRSRRKQRRRWWQLWREGFCSMATSDNYSFVTVSPQYGDKDEFFSFRPLPHSYEWR